MRKQIWEARRSFSPFSSLFRPKRSSFSLLSPPSPPQNLLLGGFYPKSHLLSHLPCRAEVARPQRVLGGSGDTSGSLIPIFPGTALSSWAVSYPRSLQAIEGSCLVVPCTFSYPADVTATDGIVAIWYKDYDGQRTVVFNSATPQDVDPRFGGRAQLLGDPMARNCSLLLRGVTTGDSGRYRFRFEIINGDRWSAVRDVTLSVSGG